MGTVGGTDTRLHGLVGAGEPTQVVADQLSSISAWLKSLPLYIPTLLLSISGGMVMFPQVGLHYLGLLRGWHPLLGLSQVLE